MFGGFGKFLIVVSCHTFNSVQIIFHGDLHINMILCIQCHDVIDGNESEIEDDELDNGSDQ